MALLSLNFESEYLKSNHEVLVIMPDRPHGVAPALFYRTDKKYPVLWLLHGTYGDQTDWIRKSRIEVYAAERNLVVVMPPALNSNYSDWNDMMLGYQMFTYLTEELMPAIYGWLPVSDKREDNFIAGLSMGGRGTIKYAVHHWDKFAAAAILSAAVLDYDKMRPGHPSSFLDTTSERLRKSIANAGGEEEFKKAENLWQLVDELAGTGKLPRLMFACGTEDELVYEQFKIFRKHAEELGLDIEWFIKAGYKHEWRFWDLAIEHALDFFGIEKIV